MEGGATDEPELPWDVPTRTLFQSVIMSMWSTNCWFPSYAHIHILGTFKRRKKNSAGVSRLLGDLFLLSCMDDPDVITEVLGHYKKKGRKQNSGFGVVLEYEGWENEPRHPRDLKNLRKVKEQILLSISRRNHLIFSPG